MIFSHQAHSQSLFTSMPARLFLALLMVLMMLSTVIADDNTNGILPGATDLRLDAKTARKEEKPILVFFSAESCPYCEVVRDLYLEPMQANMEYESKVIIREVSINGLDTMRDFNGTPMDHETFADQEGATLTPVVRIYSPAGELLAPELIGYSSPDFYLGYLEQAIEIANKKIRKRTALK